MNTETIRTRYTEAKFLTAPAIFPNNDIKYEVNKLRAQLFAHETKQAITYSIARDKPTNAVIAEKPNLEEEKKYGSLVTTEMQVISMGYCLW